MVCPIWKDIIIDLGEGESSLFYICDLESKNILYTGRAYARPGADTVTVKINDILADMFPDPVLPDLEKTDTVQKEFSALSVTVQNASREEIGDYTVVRDWSYNYLWDVERDGACEPITGEIDPRQPLLFTDYFNGDITVRLHHTDGTTTEVTVTADPSLNYVPGDFSRLDFDESFLIGYPGKAASLVVDLSGQDMDGVDEVIVGGRYHYKVVRECVRYCVFYMNSHGGWDSILCKGATVRTDKYDRNEYSKEYDNRKSVNRGTVNYLNDVEASWEFHTGWLHDEQAARMHNLTGTVSAYLYDLVDRVCMPLTIEDSSLQYRTYKGEGNSPVKFDFSGKLAAGMMRR